MKIPPLFGQGFTNSCVKAVIMVSKSKEAESAGTVFPQQDRVGVFHVLVHMVSETLRSGDRSIMAALQSEATRFVRYHLRAQCFCVSNREMQEMQSIFRNCYSDIETAGRRILGSIAAIKALVVGQTAILGDLEDIFGRAVPDSNHSNVYSNKYTKNMLRIPVLSDSAERTGGQMSYAAAMLETVIEERRILSLKGDGIFETILKVQESVGSSGV